MPFANPIIGGGGSLVYPSIHSPNFIHNIGGWSIKKDGSAEFNNLTLRGTFMGTNFEINNLGAFFYSGPPATGNLIISVTPAAGVNDGFGNAFKAHVTVYGSIPAGGFQRFIEMLASSIPGITISTGDSSEITPALIESGILNAGAANRQLETLINGAASSASIPTIALKSSAADGSIGPSLTLKAGSGLITFGDNSAGGNTAYEIQGKILNQTVNNSILNLYDGITGQMLFGAILNTFDPVAGAGTPETIHTATLLNSWTGTLQYRLEADNRTARLYGLLTAPVGVTDPSTLFTMPVGYRPTTNSQPVSAVENAGAPFAGNAKVCEVLTSGILHVYDSIAGETLRIFGSYPLDF
jgi:hypothetical protein